MKRIAILESEGLLGKELKEALSMRRPASLEVRLLTGRSDDVGLVTDGVGGAAFLQEISPETMADLDMIIDCTPTSSGRTPIAVPEGMTVLRLSTGSPLPQGEPIVAGVNPELVRRATDMVSPHPTVVALAYLLHPLRGFGIESAACWSLLPSSLHGQAGLDELLDQTRAILSFSSEQPRAIFGHQLAFNVLPAAVPGAELADQLSRIFEGEIEIALQVMQAGVFHGVVAGAHVRMSQEADVEEVRAELLTSPYLAPPDETTGVGPVAVAGKGEVLLGGVENSPGIERSLSLWAVIDNLTLGGAHNAAQILEILSGIRN